MPSRRARQRRRHAPRICAAFVGELHAARSRGTPTLPALESRLPNEKGNLSGETTFESLRIFTLYVLFVRLSRSAYTLTQPNRLYTELGSLRLAEPEIFLAFRCVVAFL